MALKDLRKQANAKYGAPPTVVLRADEPTGKAPLELFITDEHTENYLTLKMSGDAERGAMTGMLAGIASPLGLLLSLWMAMEAEWALAALSLAIAIPMFVIPFLFEISRPLPLPVLFNRRTREVYFEKKGELFHSPWDGIQAMACEFQIVGPYTGGIGNTSLDIMLHRFCDPGNSLMISLGSPIGKTLDMQKGFWEYIRSYMNNGPWFDEKGNHSQSDTFVKSQLNLNTKPSSFLAHWRKTIADKKTATNGKNYLSGMDALMLLGHIMFYPTHWIQDFTYNIAKRKSRNRWPKVVLERLQSDGPTTRLIDTEK
ncbi:DUF6708 domain-containing protein [Pseudomonas migulae]|uniref:Uncharacterized protein n=1 Tax=Pseudomonas migulae TaxID=78543 RepID=A0ABY8N0E6_9PSED|nr:DUF6708 domain-containing protein [Pseudomonas migulae]WGK92759.1 hypothetical protein MOQ58_11410 [Pseudomonas migulae]